MKKFATLFVFAMVFTSNYGQDNFAIGVKFTHPNSVIFPSEKLMLTLQVTQKGKPLNVLPNEVLVNGIAGGNNVYGTITNPATGSYTYTYQAPATMPEHPLVAIAMVIKNSKGQKITAEKNAMILANRWAWDRQEKTVVKCKGETVYQQSLWAYTLFTNQQNEFQIDNNLFIVGSQNITGNMTVSGVSSCQPQFEVQVKPGKGETTNFTSGRAVVSDGSVFFEMNGTIFTSGPGIKTALKGNAVEGTEPDADAETIRFSANQTKTPPLTAMTFLANRWSDSQTTTSGNTTTSFVVHYRPLPNLILGPLSLPK